MQVLEGRLNGVLAVSGDHQRAGSWAVVAHVAQQWRSRSPQSQPLF
jgi:hypothetical protein